MVEAALHAKVRLGRMALQCSVCARAFTVFALAFVACNPADAFRVAAEGGHVGLSSAHNLRLKGGFPGVGSRAQVQRCTSGADGDNKMKESAALAELNHVHATILVSASSAECFAAGDNFEKSSRNLLLHFICDLTIALIVESFCQRLASRSIPHGLGLCKRSTS